MLAEKRFARAQKNTSIEELSNGGIFQAYREIEKSMKLFVRNRFVFFSAEGLVMFPLWETSFLRQSEAQKMDVDLLIIGHRVAALSTRTRLAPPPLSCAPAGDRRFANSSRKLKLLYQNDRPAADFSGNARESILDALPYMKVSFHYEPRNVASQTDPCATQRNRPHNFPSLE